MRVVFDTNVFISAFVVPGSQGERAFVLALRRRFELFTSVPILTETAGRLRAKFDQTEDDVKEALRRIGRIATIVKPGRRLNVLSDAADNRILECAVEAAADVVVTGDRQLLRLRRLDRVSIVRLADFLRMFPEEEPGAR